ncbi:MAG: hypothetical protein ACR2N3_11440 [Pyrinomonadaceae bacterium]
MDVYHQVLHKLNEVTGGKQSKAVDFKDLVKKMGFHAHYSDIFERLNHEGWIIETAKADFVSISHWGVAEVKKNSAAGGGESSGELRREVGRTMTAARELAALLENFSSELSKKDFTAVEQKFNELQSLFTQTKNKLG